MPEEWRPIPGYEGMYSVSNQGRVISHARWMGCNGGMRLSKERYLSLAQKNGYLSVTLVKNKKTRWCGVHTLVAVAFIGARPLGFQVCHNDGHRANNDLRNLRYDTPAGNQADRKKHGTDYMPGGEACWSSKLTAAEVLKIRADRRTCMQLASEFGVCASTISNVRRGQTWASLKGGDA
jgi:hypothetical protein